MIQRILFLSFIMLAYISESVAQEYYVLRGTGGSSNDLEVVDVYNGNTLSTVNVTLPNTTIDGYNGLTIHPQTKTLYTIVQAGSTSKLCTLNPVTGAASLVGNLSDKFAGITFTGNGTLFGITADDALFPQTVYTINTSNAATALFTVVTGGGLGEALAYHSGQGLIYRYGGNGVLQTIDPGNKTVTTINGNMGSLSNGSSSLFYVAADDEFLFTAGEEIFTMTELGILTKLSNDDGGDGYSGAVLKELIAGTAGEIRNEAIQVYPNPSTSQLNITGLGQGQTSATITNLLGQTVERYVLNDSEILDISQLKSGIYILSLHGASYSRQVTFVKE